MDEVESEDIRGEFLSLTINSVLNMVTQTTISSKGKVSKDVDNKVTYKKSDSSKHITFEEEKVLPQKTFICDFTSLFEEDVSSLEEALDMLNFAASQIKYKYKKG